MRLRDLLQASNCCETFSGSELAAFVDEVRWKRHYGLPIDLELEDPFDTHFRSAVETVARLGGVQVSGSFVGVETSSLGVSARGSHWDSALLSRGFTTAGVEQAFVLGISAGAAIEVEIDRLWKDDRPDESMALGSAAVALVETIRHEVRRELAALERSPLPHYSPGYSEWHLSDQAKLLRALSPEFSVSLNDEYALSPSRSTLAVFGLDAKDPERSEFWDSISQNAVSGSIEYRTSEKALAKWSQQRLALEKGEGSEVNAVFRFDGTTCSQLGLPLSVDYRTRWRTEPDGGIRLLDAEAHPSADDHGHCHSSCAASDDPEIWQLMVDRDCPAGNKTIEELLLEERPTEAAGCLCTRGNRYHKWRLVLETVHYRWRQNARDFS